MLKPRGWYLNAKEHCWMGFYGGRVKGRWQRNRFPLATIQLHILKGCSHRNLATAPPERTAHIHQVYRARINVVSPPVEDETGQWVLKVTINFHEHLSLTYKNTVWIKMVQCKVNRTWNNTSGKQEMTAINTVGITLSVSFFIFFILSPLRNIFLIKCKPTTAKKQNCVNRERLEDELARKRALESSSRKFQNNQRNGTSIMYETHFAPFIAGNQSWRKNVSKPLPLYTWEREGNSKLSRW